MTCRASQSYRMNTAVVLIGIFPFTLNNLHGDCSKRLFCVVFCLFGLIDPQEFKALFRRWADSALPGLRPWPQSVRYFRTLSRTFAPAHIPHG
jgi:hypothetical protein